MSAIVEITSNHLDALRELWLSLHRHHAAIGSHPLVADEAISWQRRRALYETWLRNADAFVLIAGDVAANLPYDVRERGTTLPDIARWTSWGGELFVFSL